MGIFAGVINMFFVFFTFRFFDVNISQMPFWISAIVFTLYNINRIGKAEGPVVRFEMDQMIGFIGGADVAVIYLI